MIVFKSNDDDINKVVVKSLKVTMIVFKLK